MKNSTTILSLTAISLFSAAAQAGEPPTGVPVMSDMAMIGMSIVMAGICGRFIVRNLRKD